MESKDSVRTRLRETVAEVDDRALYEDQLAARSLASMEEGEAAEAVVAVKTGAQRAIDGFFDTLVNVGYGIDTTLAWVKARPLTTVAIAAGVGALLSVVRVRGRR